LIALDAYALIAFLADEAAHDEVEELLGETCVITVLNLAESLDVLGRVYGVSEQDLRHLVGPLVGHAFEFEPTPEEDAWTAASLRRRFYDRTSRDLSMADCFLLAAASRLEASVATADPAVAAVARDESLELIALPDSAGRRP
jgi:PIN domain nuclease of toxin-antitoxin system